jgi:hypothetical protein
VFFPEWYTYIITVWAYSESRRYDPSFALALLTDNIKILARFDDKKTMAPAEA